jgi:hypothetical protein
MKIALHTLLIIFSSTIAAADGTLMSWGPKDLSGMTHERFDAAKTWTMQQVIEKNLTVDEWPEAYLLLIAAKQHKESIVPLLIEQLDNAHHTKLKNTSRLIIWERITSGDILFEGKGLQVSDDLFSVAGRANWMLRTLTGENFGHVKPSSSPADLNLLKKKWADWNKGKKVKEYEDPYETKATGLEEIRSREALEAIIISLKPTSEKEELTMSCLTRLYKLDKLPDDPGSPAIYCSPDTYSHLYLAGLTTVEGKHDHEWWAKWWDENKDKLQWDKNKGRFEIKK